MQLLQLLLLFNILKLAFYIINSLKHRTQKRYESSESMKYRSYVLFLMEEQSRHCG